MTRVLLALSSIAVAMLTACAEYPVTPAPAPIVVAPPAATVTTPPSVAVVPAAPVVVAPAAPAPLRAGIGRIEAITPVASAAAGSTASGATNRFSIRMADGTMQYLDSSVATPALAVGDRVEITRDGFIRHPM